MREESADLEPVRLKREDLYDQAWSEPMARLAKRYGISDVALAKICRKMEIPVPPRGYWRKIETGWRPVRLPLPKLRPGIPTAIKLTAHAKPAGTAARSPEVEAQEAFEKQRRNRITVSRQLEAPHPLVRETAEVLRGAGPGVYGTVTRRRQRILDVRVGPRSLERALRIMDALIKALEARGFRLSISMGEKPSTHVQLLGQPVQIVLEERIKRTEHVPTKREGGYAPRWDYAPAGLLRLRIQEWVEGNARKTWSDGPHLRLERKLNDVVYRLIGVADAKRAWERERQREELARREAARQRALAEQRRREEEERQRVLERQAEDWMKSQQIRAFIDEVERRANGKGVLLTQDTELGKWVEWARRHSDRLDPLHALPPASQPVKLAAATAER